MLIHFDKLLLISVALVIILLLTKLLVREKYHKIILWILTAGLTWYSVIGLIYYDVSDAYLYILEYFLFLLIVVLCGATSCRLKSVNYSRTFSRQLGIVMDKMPKLVPLMAISYLFCCFFPFVYPAINIAALFDVRGFLNEYQVTSFAVKIARQSDPIYVLVTTQIKLIAMPFFYIYLYQNREKVLKFLLLFLIPIYTTAIQNGYISRNEICVCLAFVIIYFWKEKKLSKWVILACIAIGVPMLLYSLSILFYTRVGGTSSASGFWGIVLDMLFSESSFVKNYQTAAQANCHVSILWFLIYLLTLPLPSGILMQLFNFSQPQLARILTKAIIGIDYGGQGYYVLLPSVLGEGIMLFDKYFAFLYAIVVGVLIFWFLRKLKVNKVLDYYLLYFMLDVLRQMRGGSQYIFSTWITSLVWLAIVIKLCYSSIKSRYYQV